MQLIDIDLITQGPLTASFDGLSSEAIEQARHIGIAEAVRLRSTGQNRFEIIGRPDPWFLAQAIPVGKVPALLMYDLSEEAISDLSRDKKATGIIEQAADIHRRLPDYKNKADLGRALGLSRSSICNLIRVHELADGIKAMIRKHSDQVKLGHAKVLAGLSQSQQRTLLNQVIQQGLSVHETEARAKALREGIPTQSKPGEKKEKPVEVVRLEQAITELIGCETTVEMDACQLVINYSNFDVLDGVLERLGYQTGG